MPAKIQDELMPRSIMLLCMGTAALLVVAQWSGIGDRLHFNSSAQAAYKRPRKVDVTTAEVGLPKILANILPKDWVGSKEAMPEKGSGTKESTMGGSAMQKMPGQPGQMAIQQGGTSLVVDLSDRQVSVYKFGKLLASYPLAVAQPGWETPTGVFPILNMEQNPTWIHPITGEAVSPGPDNPLGMAWVGFWSDGKSEIGFHGTNQEELIGQAVSHGCLRMRNEDVQAMYAQVTVGTPVTIQE